ncbi:MAG: hypothetical protein N2Z76_01375 [Treponemataceae bacterium]|nr:hypothetical protein [Treponemataceae bacterium]
MMKKWGVLMGCMMYLVMSGWSQQSEKVVTPFSDAGGMTGLILEATGYGLVIGAGAAMSSRSTFSLGLTFFSLAPIASTAGSWFFQNYMERTTTFWVNNGVPFEGASYLNTSRTYAFITTAAAVAAVVSGFLIPDKTTGFIVSICCSAASVCSDILALYLVRVSWMEDLNKAIVTSGVDWKTMQSNRTE